MKKLEKVSFRVSDFWPSISLAAEFFLRSLSLVLA